MKIRDGFVTNSSCGNYVVGIKGNQENAAWEKIRKKFRLKRVDGVKEALYCLVAWTVMDNFESIPEDYGWEFFWRRFELFRQLAEMPESIMVGETRVDYDHSWDSLEGDRKRLREESAKIVFSRRWRKELDTLIGIEALGKAIRQRKIRATCTSCNTSFALNKPFWVTPWPLFSHEIGENLGEELDKALVRLSRAEKAVRKMQGYTHDQILLGLAPKKSPEAIKKGFGGHLRQVRKKWEAHRKKFGLNFLIGQLWFDHDRARGKKPWKNDVMKIFSRDGTDGPEEKAGCRNDFLTVFVHEGKIGRVDLIEKKRDFSKLLAIKGKQSPEQMDHIPLVFGFCFGDLDPYSLELSRDLHILDLIRRLLGETSNPEYRQKRLLD